MIVIISTNGTIVKCALGQPMPSITNRIARLTANGSELEAIKTRFTNIPYPTKAAEVVWRGDWAQFIFDNLAEAR